MSSFKKTYSLFDRNSEASRVLIKYPDRVPVICERSYSAPKDCPLIDKNKYLIPRDLTVGQFIYVIRKRMHLPAEKAIFIFINNNIPASNHMIGELYEYYRDADNFLYVTYSFENTFG